MPRFRDVLEVNATVSEQVSVLISHSISPSVQHIHLLCALYFLKNYWVQAVNKYALQCCEKTLRRWSWYFEKALVKIDIVCIHFFTDLLLLHFSKLFLTQRMSRYDGERDSCLILIFATALCSIDELISEKSRSWISIRNSSYNFDSSDLRYANGTENKGN